MSVVCGAAPVANPAKANPEPAKAEVKEEAAPEEKPAKKRTRKG